MRARSTALLLSLSLAVALPASVMAEVITIPKITTTKNKVYENCTVRKVTAEGIRILHENGATIIPAEELPEELRDRFGITKLREKGAMEAKAKAEAEAEAKAKARAAETKVEMKGAPSKVVPNGSRPAPPAAPVVLKVRTTQDESISSLMARDPASWRTPITTTGEYETAERALRLYRGELIAATGAGDEERTSRAQEFTTAVSRAVEAYETKIEELSQRDMTFWKKDLANDIEYAAAKAKRKALDLNRQRMSVYGPSKPLDAMIANVAFIDAAIAKYENGRAQAQANAGRPSRVVTAIQEEPLEPLDLEFAELTHSEYLVCHLQLNAVDHTSARFIVEKRPEFVAEPATLHVAPGTIATDHLFFYSGGDLSWEAGESGAKELVVRVFDLNLHANHLPRDLRFELGHRVGRADDDLRQVAVQRLLDKHSAATAQALVAMIAQKDSHRGEEGAFRDLITKYQPGAGSRPGMVLSAAESERLFSDYRTLHAALQQPFEDRRRTERALQWAERYFTIDASGDGILQLEEMGMPTTKRRHLRYLGYSRRRNEPVDLSLFLRYFDYEVADLPAGNRDQLLAELKTRGARRAAAEAQARAEELAAFKQSLKDEFEKRMRSRPATEVAAMSEATIAWFEKVFPIQRYHGLKRKFREGWYEVKPGHEEEIAAHKQALTQAVTDFQRAQATGVVPRMEAAMIKLKPVVEKEVALIKSGIIIGPGSDYEIFVTEATAASKVSTEGVDPQAVRLVFLYYQNLGRRIQAKENIMLAGMAGLLSALPSLSGFINSGSSTDQLLGRALRERNASSRGQAIDGMIESGIFVGEIVAGQVDATRTAGDALADGLKSFQANLEISHPLHGAEVSRQLRKILSPPSTEEENAWLVKHHPDGLAGRTRAANKKGWFSKILDITGIKL